MFLVNRVIFFFLLYLNYNTCTPKLQQVFTKITTSKSASNPWKIYVFFTFKKKLLYIYITR